MCGHWSMALTARTLEDNPIPIQSWLGHSNVNNQSGMWVLTTHTMTTKLFSHSPSNLGMKSWSPQSFWGKIYFWLKLRLELELVWHLSPTQVIFPVKLYCLYQ